MALIINDLKQLLMNYFDTQMPLPQELWFTGWCSTSDTGVHSCSKESESKHSDCSTTCTFSVTGLHAKICSTYEH